jgi:hypothetical protein
MGYLDLFVGWFPETMNFCLTGIRIWNAVWWVMLVGFYFPESQTRAKGMNARAILKKIDYAGAVLSIMGLTLV